MSNNHTRGTGVEAVVPCEASGFPAASCRGNGAAREAEPRSHNVPGTLVPKATKAIAVMVSLRPMVQPKWLARSPINAVRIPIPKMDTTKVI